MVVGAPKREKDPRLSYKLWEEPKGPDFVLEVVSRGTWRVDRDEKPKVYAKAGGWRSTGCTTRRGSIWRRGSGGCGWPEAGTGTCRRWRRGSVCGSCAVRYRGSMWAWTATVPAQLVMVIEIFIPQTQPHHPLLDQRLHRMFDAFRVAMVRETLAHPSQHPRALLHFAQQHCARIRGDLAAVEPPDHFTRIQVVKYQFRLVTLCRHEAVLLLCGNWLITQHLSHRARPLSTPLVRNPG